MRQRRVGVRAYSQTTGLWLRGIMADSEALAPQDVCWTVFEGAYVGEYTDPPWVTQAPAGVDMMEMLRCGTLDAVIVGNDVPRDSTFRTVYSDPVTAGAQFRTRYGFVPVNHLVVVRRSLLQDNPDLAEALIDVFDAAQKVALAASWGEITPLPIGRTAFRPIVETAIRFATDQNLIASGMREEDLWRA